LFKVGLALADSPRGVKGFLSKTPGFSPANALLHLRVQESIVLFFT
jgi:hypothetical protein